MASKVDKYKEFEALPFEDALKRLESIVAKMEDGNCPLEELLARFEEGGVLASLCQKRLDELQKRIEILVKDSPQGPKWRQFNPDEDEKPCDDAESSRNKLEEPEDESSEEEPSSKTTKRKAASKEEAKDDLLF